MAQAGQVAHVLHHIQRGKAVQPCIGMPLSTLLLHCYIVTIPTRSLLMLPANLPGTQLGCAFMSTL